MITAKCVVCNKTDVRMWTGRWTPSKKKVYVNSDHARWNGRKCPNCKTLLTNFGRKVAKRREELLGPKTPENTNRGRACRRCSQILSSDRYFSCTRCVPKIDYLDLSEIYGFVGPTRG